MASGPEILMKALGINPDEIKAAITDTINGIRGGLQQLDNRLKSIEAAQQQINQRLTGIEMALRGEIAEHKNGMIAVIELNADEQN